MKNTFNLFLVDDDIQEKENCESHLEIYSEKNDKKINLIYSESLEAAIEKSNQHIDGAIIDMKLAANGDEGNEIIKSIINNRIRIPIIIHTGTPDSIDINENKDHISIIRKGQKSYSDMLDELYEIHDSCISKIISGRGLIEEILSKVYFNNILKQKDTWIHYEQKDKKRAEASLLRLTVNHLLQHIDHESEFYPEESYIYPQANTDIQTGSIITSNDAHSRFIILNPACDLVVRSSGEYKTDRILLCEIENQENICNTFLEGVSRKNIDKKISNLFRNNETIYYHWLPKTDFFDGGFINFRKIKSYSKDELTESFNMEPIMQVSNSFIKDILSRFSSYYGRQGQPDIDSSKIKETYLTKK